MPRLIALGLASMHMLQKRRRQGHIQRLLPARRSLAGHRTACNDLSSTDAPQAKTVGRDLRLQICVSQDCSVISTLITPAHSTTSIVVWLAIGLHFFALFLDPHLALGRPNRN